MMLSSTKKRISGLNITTGLLYCGAAFLVLSLGLRTLLSTSNVSSTMDSIITFASYFSVIFEFCLLITYGIVYILQSSNTEAVSYDFENINKSLLETSQSFNKISKDLQNLTNDAFRMKMNSELIKVLENAIDIIRTKQS